MEILRGGPVRCLVAVLVVLAGAHALTFVHGEPFFNNDETRHVMTGVFFRDFFHDRDWTDPVGYATHYYLQYPALGLAVWPPLFYAILGGVMLAFGTSIVVTKVLVLLFGAMAGLYFFRLVLRTHQDPGKAALAVLLLGFTPIVFTYCSYVMLEIPTLAWSLASTFYFVRYLDEQRRRDVLAAALCAAAAALTRFDAGFLLVVFVVLLAGRRQLRLLLRWEVLAAAAVAIVVVLPAIAVTVSQVGQAHLTAIKVGTGVGSSTFLALANFLYYPRCVPGQMGWVAATLAVVGLATVLWRRDNRSLPYAAMVVATYVTFTPMAEIEPRHAIYWVPALTLFAVEGADALRKVARPWLVGALLVGTTAVTAVTQPRAHVRGYEAAAAYVMSHAGGERLCLFDGRLNGNFIYQMRRQDPARRMWVLRGDKVLYSMFGDFTFDYREVVHDSSGVVDVLFEYDVGLVVVEQPSMPVRMSRVLRETLRGRPDRFKLEAAFPVDSNAFPLHSLEVYRSLVRNPRPRERIGFDVTMLRRRVETDSTR
jgi:hypothetical protein